MQSRKVDIGLNGDDYNLALNMASGVEVELYDATDSKTKSGLTKLNQMVTPDDNRTILNQLSLNRASKTNRQLDIVSDYNNTISVDMRNMKHELSRTHVEVFRQAAYELESLME